MSPAETRSGPNPRIAIAKKPTSLLGCNLTAYVILANAKQNIGSARPQLFQRLVARSAVALMRSKPNR
jgi:hypothetical protein